MVVVLVNKVSFVVDHYLVDDVETLVLRDIDATLLCACACGLPHQEWLHGITHAFGLFEKLNGHGSGTAGQ